MWHQKGGEIMSEREDLFLHVFGGIQDAFYKKYQNEYGIGLINNRAVIIRRSDDQVIFKKELKITSDMKAFRKELNEFMEKEAGKPLTQKEYISKRIESIRDEYLSRNKDPELIEEYEDEIYEDCYKLMLELIDKFDFSGSKIEENVKVLADSVIYWEDAYAILIEKSDKKGD
jgi:hypothetical protein